MLKRFQSTGNRRGTQPHRIGELLISAGILSADKLPEALQLAKKTGVPLGRVLVMFGSVKQQDVDAALQIQKLIRESTIAPDFGIRALEASHNEALSIDDVLRRDAPRDYIIKNPLGELLVDAGLITRAQLTESIHMSTQAGMPLGKYLSLTGMIPTPVLFAGLNCQVAMRDKKMSRDEAVQHLKLASIKRAALPDALLPTSHGNIRSKGEMRLGELLSMAEIISETDVLAAVELGLFKGQPVGKVLVEHKLIDDSLVSPALALQAMVNRQELRPTQAAEVLIHVHRTGMPVEQALDELGLNRKNVDGWREALELLKTAGLLGDHDFQFAVAAAEASPNNAGRAILDTEAVDELLFQAALRCQQLMKQNKLRYEQAVIALHYCQRSRRGLDEAISELSWSI